MKSLFLLYLMPVILSASSFAQNGSRYPGPLGVYHISANYIYADSSGTDSIPMQAVMRFGEVAMPDQAFDFDFNFRPEIDSCVSWHINRAFGIIQPPGEGGAYNQIADTALYAPFAQSDHPGMVQGGMRFSRLSQLYGPFCGAILDDWNGDTSLTRQVREALHGKYVDAGGAVHSETQATTPYNKLYTVLYSDTALPAAIPFIDGIYYSLGSTQNCCYTKIDSDIDVLRLNFPHKEINIAVFLKNSIIGWADPVGVRYMLKHLIDRYDNGDISQVNIFAGIFMTKEYISLAQWNALALPQLLDTFYFPYLDGAEGMVYDCHTGSPLPDAFLSVYCRGRSSGDTMMRSRQKTDAAGAYECGLWAGNRNTDSTYHWVIAEKAGYISDTISFWAKRGQTIVIPPVSLCPTNSTANDAISAYPNPSAGKFTIKTTYAAMPDSRIEVYDMMGKNVCNVAHKWSYTPIDLSQLADGIYIAMTGKSNNEPTHKVTLVVTH